MTQETIAIVTVGVALAALILTALQIILKRHESTDSRLDRMDARFDQVDRALRSN